MQTLDLQTRAMNLGTPLRSDGPLMVTAIVATATPVIRHDQRGAFAEILDPAGVKLGGLDVPLLDSHDRQRAASTIGRASNFRIEDGHVVADLTFSTADDVKPIVQRVRDGSLRAFSAGYRVRKWRNGHAEGNRTRTAIEWELAEISLVSIPADPTCQKRGKHMEPEALEQRNATIEQLRDLCNLNGDWAERMQDDETLTDDQIRSAARKAMQERQRQTPRIRVHGGGDSLEMLRTRQADALTYRMAGGELPDASREFVNLSLRDLAIDALTRGGESVRGLSTDEIFQRAAHGTSDFPLVVSNAMGKVALDAYRAAESPLKRLARQRTLPNFKTSTSIRLGEMGRLEEMSENGEFTHTSRAEHGESMSLKTFGRGISVSRKLLIDDDLNMLGDLTSAIGAAAAQTEADELVATLTGNPAMSDGTPVFHASRGNLAAAGVALGAAGDGAAVSEGRKAMRLVKGLDGKTIVGTTPRYLLCGPDSEDAAQALLASIYPATQGDVNVNSGRFDLIVEPRIAGDDWWLFADPSRIPSLQFAYLSAAQGVQIQRKEAWNTLGLEFRAFLDFGTGWADWRGAYMNGGA